MRKLLTLSIVFCVGIAQAAVSPPEALPFLTPLQLSNSSITNGWSSRTDSVPLLHKDGFIFKPSATKLWDVVFVAIPQSDSSLQKLPVPAVASPLSDTRKPLLKMSGNVLYDVNYRSRIDTPYAENNVYQHTIQTRLDILYKDQYPLKVYFTSRFSNSALFRNYTDFNIRFTPSDFKRIAKQQLIESAQKWLAGKTGKLDSLSRLIESKKMAIASLRHSLEKPDVKQKMVEDRERVFYKQKPQNDLGNVNDLKDIAIDSATTILSNKIPDTIAALKSRMLHRADTALATYNDYADFIASKKQTIDSLEQELQQVETFYKKVKGYNDQDLAGLKKQIEEEKDAGKLADKLRQLNLPDSILPKGYKILSGIQSFGIGRSIADYSELSVKNISITGVQAEYNTRYYYAVAAGRVDYRFRDYIIPNGSRSNQYVAIVRFGKGIKNGNHIFLTYYTGKRQLFNASAAMQDGTSIPGYNLAGITIEGVYNINRNITLIAEIAKSTAPYYSLDSSQKSKWIQSISKMNTRSNEAYAVKLFSFFPKTFTRFSGNLSYTGANFQSFSTFTTGAAQLRWMAKLEQPFLKKQLTFISTLQKNNYTNPFVATAYKSSSLLTSLQANLQLKKLPVVSLGYFPAYQLTKVSDNYYSESRYYTLTGSAAYSYTWRDAQLSSYIVYSRFYNQGIDSGFVYYNSKNLLLSQGVNLGRFNILANGSLSTGGDYTLRMLENTLQVSLHKMISIGGGVKMIDYSLSPLMQWGYSGSLTLNIPKLGDIQLMADKGFIPGLNKQLADNKTGRLIYYKTF